MAVSTSAIRYLCRGHTDVRARRVMFTSANNGAAATFCCRFLSAAFFFFARRSQRTRAPSMISRFGNRTLTLDVRTLMRARAGTRAHSAIYTVSLRNPLISRCRFHFCLPGYQMGFIRALLVLRYGLYDPTPHSGVY